MSVHDWNNNNNIHNFFSLFSQNHFRVKTKCVQKKITTPKIYLFTMPRFFACLRFGYANKIHFHQSNKRFARAHTSRYTWNMCKNKIQPADTRKPTGKDEKYENLFELLPSTRNSGNSWIPSNFVKENRRNFTEKKNNGKVYAVDDFINARDDNELWSLLHLSSCARSKRWTFLTPACTNWTFFQCATANLLLLHKTSSTRIPTRFIALRKVNFRSKWIVVTWLMVYVHGYQMGNSLANQFSSESTERHLWTDFTWSQSEWTLSNEIHFSIQDFFMRVCVCDKWIYWICHK